jgi:hypothetical protein
MNTKPTSKQPAGRRWLDRLVSWIPRSAEDWKILGLLIGMILLIVAAIGGPILMGILKLWALFKYVFS